MKWEINTNVKQLTMTTYSYTIILNDSEIIMLEAALKLMMTHCQEKLDEGEKAPFWAHKKSAEDVLARLCDNTVQRTGKLNFPKDWKD
jgi:hypothetical protein